MKHDFKFVRSVVGSHQYDEAHFKYKNCGVSVIDNHTPSDDEARNYGCLKCDEEVVNQVLNE